MKKEFSHYGINIKVVYLHDGNFEKQLNDEGICYTFLPLIKEKVIKFKKDGIKYYAYCVPIEMDEDPYEEIFLTTEIPDDMNWQRIREDFFSQLDNNDPMLIKTRARVLYDEAKKIAKNFASKKYSENFFDWNAVKAVKKEDIEYALIGLGTSSEELIKMNHYDVPELDELQNMQKGNGGMSREERFAELEKQIEKLSIDEQNFVLLTLVKKYTDRVEIPERFATIEDYRKYKVNHHLLADCRELIDMLNFDLWDWDEMEM